MFLMASAGWGEEFSWSGSLPAGSVLTIRSVRGDILAEPSTGDRIEVSGNKKGDLQVRVIEEAGKVTICTVQPGNDRCPGGRDERRDHEKRDAGIDFKVRIPAGVHLVADTEIGKVQARGLSSPVEARTVLGNIDISTSAYARAESVNGDIRATLGKTDWDGSLSFKTVNGNIVVRLPAGANTELRATSATGRFESDLFPYEKSRYGIPGADVSGKLGKGGRTLKISTTNGSIRIEDAS
jgi:hypothetical protein